MLPRFRDPELGRFAVHAVNQFRQGAVYADKILRGAKPSDLPTALLGRRGSGSLWKVKLDPIGARLRISDGMDQAPPTATWATQNRCTFSGPLIAMAPSIIPAHLLTAFLDFLGFFLVHAGKFVARLA
jgi:hypothetical protein